MDDASLRTALLVARVVESRGCLQPGDLPDVAVSLLLEGVEDPAIAELAGLSRRANGGWDTEPLAAAACERHEIVVPGREGSTVLVARLMADAANHVWTVRLTISHLIQIRSTAEASATRIPVVTAPVAKDLSRLIARSLGE